MISPLCMSGTSVVTPSHPPTCVTPVFVRCASGPALQRHAQRTPHVRVLTLNMMIRSLLASSTAALVPVHSCPWTKPSIGLRAVLRVINCVLVGGDHSPCRDRSCRTFFCSRFRAPRWRRLIHLTCGPSARDFAWTQSADTCARRCVLTPTLFPPRSTIRTATSPGMPPRGASACAPPATRWWPISSRSAARLRPSSSPAAI